MERMTSTDAELEARVEASRTVIADREKGRSLTFVLEPELMESMRDLPPCRPADERRRIAGLPEDRIFTVAGAAGAAM